MEGGDLRMTNSIDTRIVELRFDNAQFERGIQTSLKALETLNKGLKLDGATKGLDHLSRSRRSDAVFFDSVSDQGWFARI
jgi:hypothetical protein